QILEQLWSSYSRLTQISSIKVNQLSHRFSIKGRLYPAILPVESKEVSGKVLQGITDLELDALDAFEDVEYKRETVEISLIDTSEELQAYAYIWADKDDPDLYGEWDFEEWKRLHMKEFLAMTQSFLEETERSESTSRVRVFTEMEPPKSQD
ncbi:AIG2-like protein D, partial [Asparagus officinalis]|uniref:AIG2-like protein D n=1 Tax=Asparagus officinalis TaxID=4686 RepID=UPI00098E6524